MKYAITFENNEVFQHFGKTQSFMMVEIVKDSIHQAVVSTDGKGHGELVNFLKNHNVDVLVCGGIGQGARDALVAANIALISGAKGDVDQVVEGILDGTLKDDPSGMCNHHHDHDEAHSCAGHSCSKD